MENIMMIKIPQEILQKFNTLLDEAAMRQKKHSQ